MMFLLAVGVERQSTKTVVPRGSGCCSFDSSGVVNCIDGVNIDKRLSLMTVGAEREERRN